MNLYRESLKSWGERAVQDWTHFSLDTWKLLQYLPHGIVVASGCSYALAHLLAYRFLRKGRLLLVQTPWEYIESVHSPHPLVVLSYRATSPDVKAALDHAKELQADFRILISANPEPPIGSLLSPPHKVLAMSQGADDKGFVPTHGTLTMALAILRGTNPSWWEKEEIPRGLLRVWENCMTWSEKLNWQPFSECEQIFCIATPMALSAAHNLAQRLLEGGLAMPLVSEYKNFSHGQFMQAFGRETGKKGFFFLTGRGKARGYETLLLESLEKYGPVCTIEAEGDTEEELLFSLFCRTTALVGELAEIKGKNLITPSEIPKEGERLYKYDKS